jgi:hypothetical protein
MNLRGSVLAAAVFLAGSAGSAVAATITLGGGVLSGNFGSNNVLAPDTIDTVHFTASATGTTVAGDVEVTNVFGCSLLLTLTNFSFSSSRNTPTTLTIDIAQNYSIITTNDWTGSHQFNGNVDFSAAGQMASISSVSTHETTSLPDLLQNATAAGPGTVPINRGQGPATIITPVAGNYTIHNIYTFTLTRGATGTVNLILPNSGVDQATCGLIPLPSGGLAGLAGLLGVTSFGRRRNLFQSRQRLLA